MGSNTSNVNDQQTTYIQNNNITDFLSDDYSPYVPNNNTSKEQGNIVPVIHNITQSHHDTTEEDSDMSLLNETTPDVNEMDDDTIHQHEDNFEQMHEVFQDGVEQTLYEQGYFDDNAQIYTRDDLNDAIDYGRDIGIEDAINNQHEIKQDSY